jgi:hypothetical protein
MSKKEEIWLGRGLNPGLSYYTPALYPLLHKLMLEMEIEL